MALETLTGIAVWCGKSPVFAAAPLEEARGAVYAIVEVWACA